MRRASPGLVMLAVTALPACAPITSRQQTTVAHPLRAGAVEPNRVSVPNTMGDEWLLHLPPSSLTSDASLVDVRPDEACVEVVVRAISAASPDWEMRLAIDGQEVARREMRLNDCTTEGGPEVHACTALARRNDGHHRGMSVNGGRVCLPSHGALTDRSSLVSMRLRQGMYALRFDWWLR